jgi:hypothetical protein
MYWTLLINFVWDCTLYCMDILVFTWIVVGSGRTRNSRGQNCACQWVWHVRALVWVTCCSSSAASEQHRQVVHTCTDIIIQVIPGYHDFQVRVKSSPVLLLEAARGKTWNSSAQSWTCQWVCQWFPARAWVWVTCHSPAPDMIRQQPAARLPLPVGPWNLLTGSQELKFWLRAMQSKLL